MHADLKIIVGAAVQCFACVAGAVAIQPVLTAPRVAAALADGAQALTVVGVAAGGTLAVGYVHHRLQMWASQRPVLPAPSAVYAALAHMPPALQREAAGAMADERSTPEDDTERLWRNVVTRFCVIGTTRSSFGWHAMKAHVDRPGWDAITRSLAAADVIQIGSGRRPTWYAPGWDTVRLRVALKHDWLDLPCPETGDLPVVKW